nr:pyridoxal-phosphate dependent enzyme [Mesorhizobium tianshanense]
MASSELSRHSYVLRTPLALSPTLPQICGSSAGLKLEVYQATGSFKLRGATNAILSPHAADRMKGVTAPSTGNPGRALAMLPALFGASRSLKDPHL